MTTSPVVHLTTALAEVEATLVQEFEYVPAEVVHRYFEAECAEFAAARIPAYVPVLVARGVRTRLRHHRPPREAEVHAVPPFRPGPRLSQPAASSFSPGGAGRWAGSAGSGVGATSG